MYSIYWEQQIQKIVILSKYYQKKNLLWCLLCKYSWGKLATTSYSTSFMRIPGDSSLVSLPVFFPGSCSVILWILWVFVLVVKKIRTKYAFMFNPCVELDSICMCTYPISTYFLILFLFHFLSVSLLHTCMHTHTHTRILLYVSHSFLKFLSLVWLKYAHQYFSF